MFVISVDQDTLEKAWGLHYINFNRIFLKAFLLILSYLFLNYILFMISF